MAGLGGLLSGVMKGFGAGLEQVGQVELKKQSELDLRKQMMEIESEKRLREDEVRRERDIAQIPKEASARAEAEKTVAPIKAEADVAGESARIDASTRANIPERRAALDARMTAEKLKAERAQNLVDLRADAARAEEDALVKAGVPAAKAKRLMAEFNAAEPQRKAEAKEKIDNAIREQLELNKALANDPNLRKRKISEAAGEIAVVNAREANYAKRDRDQGGGKINTADLNRKVDIAEDRLADELGVPKNRMSEALASLRKKTDDASVKKLKNLEPLIQDLNRHRDNLLKWRETPEGSKDSGKTTGEKRPIESFNR
jgi:hypothetical protein